MTTNAPMNLEQRLARIEGELESARAENRTLRRYAARGERPGPRRATFAAALLAALAAAWVFPAGSAAQGPVKAVTVCAGADRVLRVSDDAGGCRPGEQRVLLASGTAGKSASADERGAPAGLGGQAPGKGAAGSGASVTKVAAPFEVVDAQGRPILRVLDEDGTFSRGLHVLNGQGKIVAHMGVLAESEGGRVIVRDSVSTVTNHVTMAYTPSGPHVGLKGNNKYLAILNGEGFVWYNSQEKAAVKISAGESGRAGYLTVADENGAAVVEAGSTKDRRGMVRVYPNKNQSPVPVPQFLMGSKP